MTTNAIRFASGVYPSATQVRDSARSYFFEELRRVCPEVLHSLRDDLLPLYRELAERHSSAQRARVPAILTSFFALESEEPALAATVRNWCSKFHLTAELDPEPESYGPDCAGDETNAQFR